MPGEDAGGLPQRTCVGCRRRAPKGCLVRIVRRPDGSVAIDQDQRERGRGAYLCLGPECWRQARRRRSLARALRMGAGDIDEQALERDLRNVWPRSAFTS